VTRKEAQEILLLFRPGTADAEDAQIVAAMEVARRDPELGRWFEQHRRFQTAIRAGFRQIEAPEHLKIALLAAQKAQAGSLLNRVPDGSIEDKSVGLEPSSSRGPGGWSRFWQMARPPARPWWQRPPSLSAAAAIILLVGLALLWPRPNVPDRFADYRAMMVSKAVRGYNMDWPTDNMRELRQRLEGKGAPADYELTQGLGTLHLTGGATFTWRGNPVAMVCFNRATNQNFWLFVMKTKALKDSPSQTPKLDGVLSGLKTASWTRGANTYLLAGPDEPDFAQKFLPQL
jgi:hypothetical protein